MSVLVHVGPTAAEFTSDAQFLDGEHPVPRAVRVRADDTRKMLLIEDGDGLEWPLDEIREIPDQAGGDIFVLRLAGDGLQRLILPDRGLRPRLPKSDRVPPTANRGRLMGWAVAALASVALIVFVLVPLMADQLAEYIPPEGERALGQVTLEQIRGALDETGISPIAECTGAEGVLALAKMEERLQGVLDLPVDLSVHVLDHDMVNAFALPGGFVVFFRGLLDEAETPEQVAAVFAHEIGHVVSRDPTRHALRSAGSIGVLGLLFGDFAGGALVLFLAERLIDAQYSQTAEAEADAFAHNALIAADLPPSALADMFERLRAKGGDVDGFVAHFLAHPRLGDRIEAARAATPEGFRPRALMTASEWQALKSICR